MKEDVAYDRCTSITIEAHHINEHSVAVNCQAIPRDPAISLNRTLYCRTIIFNNPSTVLSLTVHWCSINQSQNSKCQYVSRFSPSAPDRQIDRRNLIQCSSYLANNPHRPPYLRQDLPRPSTHELSHHDDCLPPRQLTLRTVPSPPDLGPRALDPAGGVRPRRAGRARAQ